MGGPALQRLFMVSYLRQGTLRALTLVTLHSSRAYRRRSLRLGQRSLRRRPSSRRSRLQHRSWRGRQPMTSATHAAAQLDAEEAARGSFLRLLQSEWTKIRSVRSTVWSLLLLVVLTLGFTALFMGLTVGQWSKTSASLMEAMRPL